MCSRYGYLHNCFNVVPMRPKFVFHEKMSKVSVDEDEIRFAKTVATTRSILISYHAERMVFSIFDNEPCLFHTIAHGTFLNANISAGLG